MRDQSQLRLSFTAIAAPGDGAVGDRSVRVGQFVQPGSRLITIVPVHDIYLVANFKETQLSHMYRGEKVDFTLDAFPDATFAGTIDSMAPGTGAQFALLPAENATGNFTKIVQRVPVKILIDPNSLHGIDPAPRPVGDRDRRYAHRARWRPHHIGPHPAKMSDSDASYAVKTTPATARDWLAIAGGMVGCFMAILDIQITNSSLAQIEGSVGASVDEGSWISTAYLIAEIIVIPLTGWLSTVFGLRRYLSASTVLFVGFSIACAWSTSLPELILFRAGQGFTGGALIPAGITIINRHLPPAQQMVGMAIFGVGVTFAPALGPTIGGWLTENLSWHYIFYLNIGPGMVAIALQLYGLNREKMRLSELIHGDWWGRHDHGAGPGRGDRGA